jgi:hypothetical protein
VLGSGLAVVGAGESDGAGESVGVAGVVVGPGLASVVTADVVKDSSSRSSSSSSEGCGVMCSI